jgi:hypothetical protein
MNLPATVSNRLFDSYTNELMAFVRNCSDNDDWLCLQKLAVKLTQFSIFDWGDQQLSIFLSQILQSIETVEHAQQEDLKNGVVLPDREAVAEYIQDLGS